MSDRQERKYYYQNQEKARAEPEKYMTIIIDGMDQTKTNIPLLLQETKSTQNLYRLQTHHTGSIVQCHTRSPHGKHHYAFFDLMQWSHDSNLVLQVLGHVLNDFKESLPQILYLQLDNTSRENKNRFIFGFCAMHAR